MKFKHDPSVNINGTSFIGYLGATIFTARKIEAVFGLGATKDCEKVRFQWTFCDDKGRPFTLYDYRSSIGRDTPYNWHLGGHYEDNFRSLHAFRNWLLNQLGQQQ